MKNLSLFVSAFTLCASTSYAAINCGTLPTCESLGYTDTVSQCPKKSIKCPFDVTKGTCLHEAAVGEIAYFTKDPGKGWLLCDGQTITKAVHPELYAFLGQQFCTEDHGGTCGTDVGRVPDYRGFYLRVGIPLKKPLSEIMKQYGTTWPSKLVEDGTIGNALMNLTRSVNLKTLTAPEKPQKEGLPNITGWWGAHSGTKGDGSLIRQYSHSSNIQNIGSGNGSTSGLKFDASLANSIYGSSTGVTPVNYAVYAYIYAGKIVQ